MLLMAASRAAGQARLPRCDAGFEISQACVTERGLDQKRAAYQRKLTEAMLRLGASYKMALRLVNHPFTAGYDVGVGDVFTDVVRDEEMRNQSFIISVTASFLEEQPEILHEASALHEVCHVMNDDLSGYHRNGANTEAAEERCVLDAVGEARYRQYLQAYAAYRHWDGPTYERVLQTVKEVALEPAPRETDEADRLAAEYFRRHGGAKARLLAYSGELHDVTHWSAGDEGRHDPANLKAFIKPGKRLIFFHNHATEGGTAAMFPGGDDFEAAGLLSFMAYAEDPTLTVEFRAVQPGPDEDTIVAYGLKGAALEAIKTIALDYRQATGRQREVALVEAKQKVLNLHLARDAFDNYLKYICPVDPDRTDAEPCRTHPEYFLWPSDRFFARHRAQ